MEVLGPIHDLALSEKETIDLDPIPDPDFVDTDPDTKPNDPRKKKKGSA